MSVSTPAASDDLARATTALMLAVAEYYRHAVTMRAESATLDDGDDLFMALAQVGEAVFPLEKAAHLGKCDASRVATWSSNLLSSTAQLNLPAACPSSPAMRTAIDSLRLATERFATAVRHEQQRTGELSVTCR